MPGLGLDVAQDSTRAGTFQDTASHRDRAGRRLPCGRGAYPAKGPLSWPWSGGTEVEQNAPGHAQVLKVLGAVFPPKLEEARKIHDGPGGCRGWQDGG